MEGQASRALLLPPLVRTRHRRELAHGGGGGDLAAIGVGFVVLLDVIEVIEIVHHQPERLLEAGVGEVAARIEALQPRAVPEVKARDRIERAARGRARVEIIMRGERRNRSGDRLGRARLRGPAGMIGQIERSPGLGGERLRSRVGAFAREPGGEAGRGRQRDEVLQSRPFPAQILDDLLDQEIAETDALESALRVRDRIEDGRRRGGRRERRRSDASRGWIASGIAVVRATSTKIKGSSSSAG